MVNVSSVARVRAVGLDRLRGLAVLLMILDHVCVFALVELELAPAVADVLTFVRMTATRASLPLFGVVAGIALVCWPRSSRSNGRLVRGAGLALVLGAVLPFGLGQPDVLALFCIVLVLGGSMIRRYPATAASLGIIQSFTWPLGSYLQGWTGYELGVLVALVAVGVLVANRDGFHTGAIRASNTGARLLPRWLELPGRHPVGLYLAHVTVLGAAAVVL